MDWRSAPLLPYAAPQDGCISPSTCLLASCSLDPWGPSHLKPGKQGLDPPLGRTEGVRGSAHERAPQGQDLAAADAH